MGVLSGYKRFKKYLRTGDGYKLCSEWTKSDSVEMNDGKTLQENMDNVAEDVESTRNDIADVHNELKTSLGGMTFGVDAAGRYGYIKAGADTVTPFKIIPDSFNISFDFHAHANYDYANIRIPTLGYKRLYVSIQPSNNFKAISIKLCNSSNGIIKVYLVTKTSHICDINIPENVNYINFEPAQINEGNTPGYMGVGACSVQISLLGNAL